MILHLQLGQFHREQIRVDKNRLLSRGSADFLSHIHIVFHLNPF